MKKIKIGETEKKILLAIGAGILISATLVLPNLPMALKPFFKRQGKKKFHFTLKRLEEKGVIYLSGDRIKLSKRGKELLKIYEISKIEIPRPKRWNRIWHLVSYDIPDSKKKERDWFAKTLKDLGFERIQESLWVYPFECDQEIAVIAQNLGISPHVAIMMAKKIPREEKMKEEFNL